MILLGLTGSIAMGKSFVAGVLTKMGIPVLDSDAVVHDLYAPGGAAVEPVRALFGASVVAEDGGISRSALGALVLGPENEANMRALEAAVHPLVDDARWAFLDAAEADAHPLVVIDIPLLYEKGYEDTVDAVMVASTGDADEQRARALARPGMTPEKFESILARQVPDEKKRERADFIVETKREMAETEAAVRALVERVRGGEGGVAPRALARGRDARKPRRKTNGA